ncbi:hypothetical protein GCM10027511_18570 [Hymenobacter humi]
MALAIQGLQDRNVVDAVVEQQQWRRRGLDSTLVSSQLTHYYADGHPQRLWQARVSAPQPFTSAAIGSNGTWLQDARYEETLAFDGYDAKGNLLQQHRPQGLPSAYGWGYGGTKPIAYALNAAASQLACTSFEAGELRPWVATGTGGAFVTTEGYTGTASYRLGSASGLQSGPLTAATYAVSCWARQGTEVPKANGQPLTYAGVEANGWRLYATQVAIAAGGQITVSGAGVVDELRVFPVGAQVTTYTHDPLDGTTSQTDPQNRTVFFEYDALGRLVRTRDEQGRILSQQQYHYAGQ